MCAATKWIVAKKKKKKIHSWRNSTSESRKYLPIYLLVLGPTLETRESKVNEIFH